MVPASRRYAAHRRIRTMELVIIAILGSLALIVTMLLKGEF
jgi:hypothetical protein